ncbi:MAG: DUF1573 domain-containing protein [Cyclobacteriaceae bacterium]|nr:DUF1573 domain-containing protein [Cyclobacteriaceae bacterium]
MKKLLIIVFAIICFEGNTQQVEQIIFREKLFDFGDVDETKGSVNHEFVFTNNSGKSIKIISVDASCGCTTPGWSQNSIAQGATGFIKASFDPKGRPGYFNKTLSVRTSLDNNPVILQIKGQVVDGKPETVTDFHVDDGNLYFKAKSFSFGTVYINRPSEQKQFPVMNGGTVPIKFISVSAPSYMKVEMPAELAPQEKGFIKISYDGKKKNQFGFASDNIQITTDDHGYEAKSFSVFASLEEYYVSPVGAEATQVPTLFMKEQSIDLGSFRSGRPVNTSMVVINTGKKDLTIKSLQGNCSCITAETEKNVVKPGDSTTLKISFTPQKRGGTQQKAITVYSDDPRNPIQRLLVQAFIEED